MVVTVVPSIRRLTGNKQELVLRSLSDPLHVWTRRYEAYLAAAFDAHELNLFESVEVLDERGLSKRLRLREVVEIDEELLEKFRFESN